MDSIRPLPERVRFARRRFQRVTALVTLPLFAVGVLLPLAVFVYHLDVSHGLRKVTDTPAGQAGMMVAAVAVNAMFAWSFYRSYSYRRWPCPVCGGATARRNPSGTEGNYVLGCGGCDAVWDSGEKYTPYDATSTDRSQIAHLDRGGGGTPNQMVCCQGVIFDPLAWSNGVRLLSTPQAIIKSFRMHAPMAAIFGMPAATSRP